MKQRAQEYLRAAEEARRAYFAALCDIALAATAEPEEEPESFDPEACPGCGCKPGDGITESCNDSEGCGWSKYQRGLAEFAAEEPCHGCGEPLDRCRCEPEPPFRPGCTCDDLPEKDMDGCAYQGRCRVCEEADPDRCPACGEYECPADHPDAR